MLRRTAWVLAALAAMGCGDEVEEHSRVLIDASTSGTEPCLWGRATGSEAAAVRLVSRREYPCDILAVPRAVLRGRIEGEYPDPGLKAVLGPRGRIYTTANLHEPLVLVWDSSGAFVTAFGRSGLGPGEFSPRGALHLISDTRGYLHVLDGHNRWSVFDPDFELVTTFMGTATGRLRGSIQLLDDGRFLTTGFLSQIGRSHAFTIAGAAGAWERSFGPPLVSPRSVNPATIRHSAYGGGSTFWVAPHDGGPLILEEWSLDGERLRTLTRVASWMDAQSGASRSADLPLMPAYDYLHIDDDGLLWYMVALRDEHAGDAPARAADRGRSSPDMFDVRFEVVDPAAGEVLASVHIDEPGDSVPPIVRFIPRSRMAYRTRADSLGLQTLDLFEIRLIARAR